jgi:hypothetical protein
LPRFVASFPGGLSEKEEAYREGAKICLEPQPADEALRRYGLVLASHAERCAAFGILTMRPQDLEGVEAHFRAGAEKAREGWEITKDPNDRHRHYFNFWEAATRLRRMQVERRWDDALAAFGEVADPLSQFTEGNVLFR